MTSAFRTTATLVIAFAAGTALADGFDARALLRRDADWLRGNEGRRIIANVLSHQSAAGSWPKNIDTSAKRYDGDPAKLAGTFDNGATTGELRFLAHVVALTGDAPCREAFLRGFDHILKAQYPTGGWPQYYPPSKAYHRHITFNDGSMQHILEFLRDTTRAPEFAFLNAARRKAAADAFDRGLACIVKCQIRVDGRLTVWCAQHDEIDLSPRPARSYELVSLSGAESAGLLQFLMSIEHPSPELVRAVHAGAAWFERSRITGVRGEKVDGDFRLKPDPTAPPLWARFYEIDTNRPFFCDRDGVKKYDIAQIGHERRNGYAWYGNWGEGVAKAYAGWKTRLPAPASP